MTNTANESRLRILRALALLEETKIKRLIHDDGPELEKLKIEFGPEIARHQSLPDLAATRRREYLPQVGNETCPVCWVRCGKNCPITSVATTNAEELLECSVCGFHEFFEKLNA